MKGGGIEVQSIEFGVYPGNKNLYGLSLSDLPLFIWPLSIVLYSTPISTPISDCREPTAPKFNSSKYENRTK